MKNYSYFSGCDICNKDSIHKQAWPQYDQKYLVEDTITIVFSVNGKVRDKADVAKDTIKKDLEQLALASANIQKYITGKEIIKKIVVPNKLVNIVVK